MALAAISSVVGLALLELGARAFGWGDVVVFARNEDWGFLMKPSQTVSTYGHPIQINSLGLRGPELQDPKPPGTKRIVFIGDSVTYGGGHIAEEDLFCRIVESKAATEGIDVEAVNLASPAWSPQNWWEYVQRIGLFHADIVVLTLPECDLQRNFSTIELGGHLDYKPKLRLESVFLKLCSRFEHDRLSARQRIEEITAANFNAVAGLQSKCEDIGYLPVLIPSQVPSSPNEELWSIFMPKLPRAIDLRQELQNPSYFLDGSHLNVAGHKLVAMKIFDRLRSELTRN